MDWKTFLEMENESRDILTIKKIYFRITKDLVIAHLLSQIIYWFLPGKNGQSKIRIKKDEKEWIAKKRTDWFDECCIFPHQFDRGKKVLEKMGIIESKVYKFKGEPTVHITLCKDNFIKILENYLGED